MLSHTQQEAEKLKQEQIRIEEEVRRMTFVFQGQLCLIV